jgi:hypothetical protein
MTWADTAPRLNFLVRGIKRKDINLNYRTCKGMAGF